MSVSKDVEITVHDASGRVLGTVMAKPKASMWRATGRPPWVNVGGLHMKAWIVGKGREATLHVALPKGTPTPKRLRPIK